MLWGERTDLRIKSLYLQGQRISEKGRRVIIDLDLKNDDDRYGTPAVKHGRESASNMNPEVLKTRTAERRSWFLFCGVEKEINNIFKGCNSIDRNMEIVTHSLNC